MSSTLITERLILRPPDLADAETMFDRYASDLEVTRYLGWPRHTEIDQTRAFIQFSNERWEQDKIGPYLILNRESGRIMGGTGLDLTEPNIASTGYVLTRDAWGQGYATEALGAMVDLAKSKALKSVFALCHPEHAASSRVLEKCGFKLEEKLKDYIEFPNLRAGVKSDALKYRLITA